MRYARGIRLWCFVEQVGYGCRMYWPVCTLVPQFLLVAFLISIGHFFNIPNCCLSIAQSHLEVGDVSVNFCEFLVPMCQSAWNRDSEDVMFLHCCGNIGSHRLKLAAMCLHKVISFTGGQNPVEWSYPGVSTRL